MFKALFLLGVFFLPALLFAQDEPDTVLINNGGVSLTDLEMTSYSKDSSAKALVLFKRATVGYDMPKKRFYLVLHVQTKIFSTEAFHLANVSIIHSRKNWMRVMGSTYNLENGEIVNSVLNEDEVITDKFTDNVYKTTFALPNVREGSVLEYKYILFSDSPFEFLPWHFQGEYPIAFSEISVGFPQLFMFRPRLHGHLEANEVSSDGSKKWYRLNMFDVPAISEEPYMRNIKDHYAKLSFVYSSSLFKSWNSLAEQMTNNSEYFGESFKKDKWLNSFSEHFERWNTADMKAVSDIYEFVTQRIKWNGKLRVFPDGLLKKAWDQGEGSSADINIILLMLLRKVGFNAYPVLVSTAENGEVAKELVSYGQFNTVIVLLDLGGKRTLINATSENQPLGYLPPNFLNSEGLLVMPKQSEWVSTNLNEQKDVQAIGVSAKLNSDEGLVSGELGLSLSGGRATDIRSESQGKTSAEIFDLGSNISGSIELDSIKVENFDSPNEPLQFKVSFTDEQLITEAGERIFFNPVIFNNLEQNPFKAINRQFPVEFTRPFNNKLFFEYEIPEGYIVEQLPATASYSLPENDGKYAYQTYVESNKVVVYISLAINKSVFHPSEYEGLRKLFELATLKQSEVVILQQKE